MALAITIAGSSVTFLEDSFQLHYKLDERQRCQFTVINYAGTLFFSRGAQVIVTDPVLGRLFEGYVIDDKQDKSNVYPDPTVEHQIDTIDNLYLASKRTSHLVYTTPQQAGKIVVDMVRTVLASEGVVANYAVDQDTTQANFAMGTLTNVVAANSVGDGDLELAFSSSVTQSYNTQALWQAGTLTNIQANVGGDLSLVGVTRNWNDGNKSNQTLFGYGSSSDSVSGGQYILPSTAGNEERSRLDFAGNWTNATIEVDVVLASGDSGGNLRHGIVARTSGWSNVAGSYAYLLNMTSTFIEIRRGSNGGASGSNTQLTFANFSPSLGAGTYRMRFVLSGNTLTGYVNGKQYVTATDSTYPGAGMIALRNNNEYTNATQNEAFGNFGVMAATSGTWQSSAVSINGVSSVASSVIRWDQSLSTGGTVLVQTSIDGGSSFQTVSNGGAVNPGVTVGFSGVGKTVITKVTLSNTTTATMPDIQNLSWSVVGGYAASGTRSTAPLGNDTMVRVNQSGWGTAFDGQTWVKTGTGTDAISSNEATITNTTGDVHEVLGSATAGNQDATVRFKLSASTISAGIELRYADVNDLYRFSVSTTTLTIIKISAGLTYTFPTVAMALSTGTFYRLRFRVTGDTSTSPVSLQGRVWLDGTLEPGAWSISVTD